MINVSSEFKELMNERTDFKENAIITLTNGTVLNLSEDDFSVSNNYVVDGAEANSFPLGVAVSRNIQIELMNSNGYLSAYDFFGAKIRLYLTFSLSETVEKIECGTFTVLNPETYGTTVIITANDDMYKADKAYTSDIVFPTTAQSVLIDSCSTCGISLLSTSFLNSDFIIQTKPSSEYTHRQVIGYIAMIAVGNARINRQGYLEILSYNFDFTARTYHELTEWKNLKTDTGDITITGIQTTYTKENTSTDGEDNEVVLSEEVTLLEGNKGYVLSIENPLISGKEQAVIELIADNLVGISFRKFEGDYIGYPIAEFMDLAKITDGNGNVYNTFLTDVNFTFFGFTIMKNSAESALRNGSMYVSAETQAIIAARKLVEREKTNRELAIEKLAKALSESSGMYITPEMQSDGSSIYYMHNKPTLSESDIIWKLTAEAFGISTDGGKTYPYGFTITGEMITRLLYAEGINADYVLIGSKTVGEVIAEAESSAKDYSDGKLADYANTVSNDLAILQAQVDGQVEDWYYDYEPSIQNYPASEWTTTEERTKHIGDRFFWKSKGYAYRFMQDDNGAWGWVLLQDTDITKALQAAANAQDTADGKRRVFVVTPQPPYDIGDLWTDGTDILTCTVSRASGSAYMSSDWKKLNKYTDDSFAKQVQENLDNLQIGGIQILRGTNTVTALTSTGVWSNGTWRRASTGSDSTGNTRTSIKVTDAPNPNIKVGWEITRNAGNIDIAQDSVPVTQGQTYTMSCYAKGTGLLRLQYGKSPYPTKTYTLSNLTKWTKYSFTFTIGAQSDGSTAGITNICIGNGGNGTLEICGMLLETGNRATDWTPAPEDTETYADNLAADLQTQIDGKIQTYNQTTDPSTEWTTTEQKTQHTGDLWYNSNTKETKRWSGTAWVKLENKEAEEAGALASKKAQVFTGTPTVPYYVGDLWFNSSTSDIMTCTKERTTGGYTASDWTKRNKYTDDTAANEALEEAQKARNLNIILDNEYQGIPADYDGNISEFPTVQTVVQVLYGHTDVSVNCSYSIAKSAGITGTWNNATRTYTVTGLTADSGWVDITASYLDLFSATKRFNVSKTKGGENGVDGSSFRTFTTNYSGTQTQINEWSVTGYSSNWNVNESTDGVKIGDSVLLQVKNTSKGGDSFVIANVTEINNTNRLTAVSIGLIDKGDKGETGERGLQGLQGPKGEQGIPGAAGADGKTSYTHIAYANSADGRTDFSVSNSDRQYIGMYADFNETDSTDPAKYAWSKIKGADGAQGIPGAAGADGRTPYFHIAYANSADGQTGFSVTDSENKSYIGQYTDYTSADSTDPAKYAWTKIKGDKGDTGAASRVYMLDASDTAIKKGADNVLSPASVTFSSYYRDGDAATRTAYSGRFRIEESLDGTAFTSKYTSSANESSKVYTPSSGNVKIIRCTLYAAGGTTNALDNQSVVVLTDVSNLEIGGRNLLLKTGTPQTITSSGGANKSGALYYLSVDCAEIQGKNTILSYDWEYTGETPSGTFRMQTGEPQYSLVTPVTKISEDSMSGHISQVWIPKTRYSFKLVYIRTDNMTGTLKISNLRLYMGNKDIGWTPAPEDQETLIVTLSNEAHTITTDKSGNGGSFTDCETTVQVYSGTQDVTADATYTVTAGTGVTGSWDGTNYKYKVTALSTDNGYADINVTYNGVTVIKRFTISKSKTGADGAKGDKGDKGDTGATGDNGKMLYAASSTAAATAAKVATITPTTTITLYTGLTVTVKFTNANTVANPTLNINNTGAKTIYAYGAALTSTSPYNWAANATVTFVYTGSQWSMTNTSADAIVSSWCYNNDKTYINGAKLYTGSVTTDKLAAKAVTAAKIDVTDLFAQNITATGTITGVNIKGATGEFTKSFSVSVPVTIDNTAQRFYILTDSDAVKLGVEPQLDDGESDFAKLSFIPGEIRLASSMTITLTSDSGVVALKANKGAIVLEGNGGVSINAISSDLKPIPTNYCNLGTSDNRWLQCHATNFYEAGVALSSKYNPMVNVPNNQVALSTVSVANSTWTSVGNFTLEAGQYIIFATVSFASNATGRRHFGISDQSGANHSQTRFNTVITAPTNGSATQITFPIIYRPGAKTTYYMNAWQNSGGALNVSAGYTVFKFR